MTLDREQAWYDAHKAELLSEHKGKWIAVHQEQLIGVFDDAGQAYNAAVEKTGCEEILIRRVVEKDEPFSAPALTLGILSAPVFQS